MGPASRENSALLLYYILSDSHIPTRQEHATSGAGRRHPPLLLDGRAAERPAPLPPRAPYPTPGPMGGQPSRHLRLGHSLHKRQTSMHSSHYYQKQGGDINLWASKGAQAPSSNTGLQYN